MHSKMNTFKVFELNQKVVEGFFSKEFKIKNFNLEHEFLWEFINSNSFFSKKNIIKYSAKDFNSVKFLNSCQNLSFFDEPELIIIFDAQSLVKEQIEDLKSSLLYSTDKEIILVSTGKKKDLTKIFTFDDIEIINIDNFKFWETASYINFLINYFNVEVDQKIKQYLLTNFENDLITLYLTVKDMANLLSYNKITVNEIEEYFSSSYRSIFEVATELSLKKFKSVFNYLKNSFDDQKFEIYLILNFLLKHTIKLSDSEALNKKSKLSKYEKEILKFSSSWSQKEIERMVNVFSELVLLCKKKDSLMINKIQSYVLLSSN